MKHKKSDPNNPLDLVKQAIAITIPQFWEDGYAHMQDPKQSSSRNSGGLSC